MTGDAAEIAGVERDDEELVMAYQRGDAASFDVLVDRYAGRIFSFACGYVGERSIAEDISQDTFLRVIEKVGQYRSTGLFRSWIFMIARNLCLDHLRRRTHMGDPVVENADGETSDLIAAEPSRAPAPDRNLEQSEIRTALAEALRSLPEEQREVLLLKEEGGLKFHEIAKLLNIPAGTAKSRLHYALRSVRNHLAARDFTREEVLE